MEKTIVSPSVVLCPAPPLPEFPPTVFCAREFCERVKLRSLCRMVSDNSESECFGTRFFVCLFPGIVCRFIFRLRLLARHICRFFDFVHCRRIISGILLLFSRMPSEDLFILSHFHTFTQNSIFIFRFFLILPAKCRNLSLSRPIFCIIHIFFVPLHPQTHAGVSAWMSQGEGADIFYGVY